MIYTIGNTSAIGLIAKVCVNGNVVDKTFYADTEKRHRKILSSAC